MNPTPHIIPSALLLLVAFFLGCLIGYAIRRIMRRSAAPVAAPIAAAETPPEAPLTESAAPEPAENSELGLLPAPLEGRADDLKQIKGIGPKLEQKLNENGVYHHHQIAAWDMHAVEVMNAKLGFKDRIERERWVSQAQNLVKEEAR